MFPLPPELLSLGAVCQLLGLTPGQLERLKRLAEVSAVLTIDGVSYFTREDVTRLQDNRGLLRGPRFRGPGDE